MTSDDSYYALLGVAVDAPKEEIRAAYRDKLEAVRASRTREEGARRPSDDAIRAARDEEARLRAAWQVLSDPVQRERYDTRIGVDGSGEGEELDDAAEAEEGGELEVLEPAAEEPGQPVGSVVTDRGLEIPTTGRRFTAVVIDGFTALALWSVVALPLVFALGLDKGAPAFLAEFGTLEAIVIGYFIIPTWRVGQTLGKRYTYCMVVDRATGRLPSLGQAIQRYLLPAFALALLGSFGPIVALFIGMSFLMSRDQISLLDRFARTAVVIARYKPERSAGFPPRAA